MHAWGGNRTPGGNRSGIGQAVTLVLAGTGLMATMGTTVAQAAPPDPVGGGIRVRQDLSPAGALKWGIEHAAELDSNPKMAKQLKPIEEGPGHQASLPTAASAVPAKTTPVPATLTETQEAALERRKAIDAVCLPALIAQGRLVPSRSCHPPSSRRHWPCARPPRSRGHGAARTNRARRASL